MSLPRSAGLLLHPTALPGPYGIGDLGPAARRWIDVVADAGCSWWQVLPLGPTGYRDSPYQSLSSFAGNPLLISPEGLVDDGLLRADELAAAPAFHEGPVDFGRVYAWKEPLLDRAADRLLAASTPGPATAVAADFVAFRHREAAWLDTYALFVALKRAHAGRSWVEWPAPLRDALPGAITAARAEHATAIGREAFRQWAFARQWSAMRAHARTRGVSVIGDMPIFVAHDSADVWAHRRLFQLDALGRPIAVAGVPPDYFAKTGQLWGNPLYRWEAHAAEGYAWWIARMKAVLRLVDLVRLDHFRGFAAYWEVPSGQITAEAGRWVPGPGATFLTALERGLAGLPLIAEDLGDITQDVFALRDRFRLPGMRVLQFAFSDAANPFLPHHHVPNCVVYTGTHDNETITSWYANAPAAERAFFEAYRGPASGSVAWDLIRMAWASVADLAMTTPQDLLELGDPGRVNFPGKAEGNWSWRLPAEFFAKAGAADRLAARLLELGTTYGRTRSAPADGGKAMK